MCPPEMNGTAAKVTVCGPTNHHATLKGLVTVAIRLHDALRSRTTPGPSLRCPRWLFYLAGTSYCTLPPAALLVQVVWRHLSYGGAPRLYSTKSVSNCIVFHILNEEL